MVQLALTPIREHARLSSASVLLCVPSGGHSWCGIDVTLNLEEAT
jgi:broad specificity polyphosphatase/5'/3'-nucleotidase SurE